MTPPPRRRLTRRRLAPKSRRIPSRGSWRGRRRAAVARSRARGRWPRTRRGRAVYFAGWERPNRPRRGAGTSSIASNSRGCSSPNWARFRPNRRRTSTRVSPRNTARKSRSGNSSRRRASARRSQPRRSVTFRGTWTNPGRDPSAAADFPPPGKTSLFRRRGSARRNRRRGRALRRRHRGVTTRRSRAWRLWWTPPWVRSNASFRNPATRFDPRRWRRRWRRRPLRPRTFARRSPNFASGTGSRSKFDSRDSSRRFDRELRASSSGRRNVVPRGTPREPPSRRTSPRDDSSPSSRRRRKTKTRRRKKFDATERPNHTEIPRPRVPRVSSQVRRVRPRPRLNPARVSRHRLPPRSSARLTSNSRWSARFARRTPSPRRGARR